MVWSHIDTLWVQRTFHGRELRGEWYKAMTYNVIHWHWTETLDCCWRWMSWHDQCINQYSKSSISRKQRWTITDTVLHTQIGFIRDGVRPRYTSCYTHNETEFYTAAVTQHCDESTALADTTGAPFWENDDTLWGALYPSPKRLLWIVTYGHSILCDTLTPTLDSVSWAVYQSRDSVRGLRQTLVYCSVNQFLRETQQWK